MTMSEASATINGRLQQYHPLLSLGNLIVLVGAAMVLWGMVNSMETRISQNEELLKEVRLEVRLLSDVNRRLAALEAEITNRRGLIQDYIGTKSTFEYRLNAVERAIMSLRRESEPSEDSTSRP